MEEETGVKATILNAKTKARTSFFSMVNRPVPGMASALKDL